MAFGGRTLRVGFDVSLRGAEIRPLRTDTDKVEQHTMNDVTVARNVTVSNPQGLHARPAEMFVRMANQFQAKIEVIKDGECVDGKSILEILTLFAVQGTQLSIHATGCDAPDAVKALTELVAEGFAEQQQVSDEK
jgi:phosphocarrier protein HPr